MSDFFVPGVISLIEITEIKQDIIDGGVPVVDAIISLSINDLGYKGNQPNFWDGVPDDIMKEHGFSYDKDWKYNFVDPMTRNDLAEWDENGNLIT